MTQESIVELQKIDCNCNDCIYMSRDFAKLKSFDHLHKGQEKASHRVNYGFCTNKLKNVSFIANTCQLNTQVCFKHRKEIMIKIFQNKI
jgi:hypothetical protein